MSVAGDGVRDQISNYWRCRIHKYCDVYILLVVCRLYCLVINLDFMLVARIFCVRCVPKDYPDFLRAIKMLVF